MRFSETVFVVAGIAYPVLFGWGWLRRDVASKCFWVATLWGAGATAMMGSISDWPLLPRLLFSGMIGAGLLIGLTEGVRWAALAQHPQVEGKPIMSDKPSTPANTGTGPIQQSNQSGTNIGQQNNYYAAAPNPLRGSDVISQAGAAVGKVFGGRRSPADATVYEFVEITNANQLNPSAPFAYEGQLLVLKSVRSRVGLDISRPQDGMVYGGVVANVVGKAD